MNRAALSAPHDLGAVTLKNRWVVAPEGHHHCADADGLPSTEMVEDYYAKSQAGLIVAEGAAISPTACGGIDMAGIYTDAQRLAWSAIADAVHAAGSRIVLPLLHAGRVSHRSLQPGQTPPLAPSTGRAFCFVSTQDESGHRVRRLCDPARAMEQRDIDALVRDFRETSVNALRAGFDLVEINAGRGQLLHQFLSRDVNRRSDQYGGSLENRARLLLKIVEIVVLQCGADRVGVNLAPLGGFNGLLDSDGEDMACYLATALAQHNIAYLRIAAPGWHHGPQLATRVRVALRADFARTIVATGLENAKNAADLVTRGLADVVGYPAVTQPENAAAFTLAGPESAVPARH